MSEHVDSNYGPSACKADALNQLSYAPIVLAPRFELGLLPWKGRDLTIGRHEHKSRVLHPLVWRWDLTALLGWSVRGLLPSWDSCTIFEKVFFLGLLFNVVAPIHYSFYISIWLKGSGLSQFNIALCYSDPVGIWTRDPYIVHIINNQVIIYSPIPWWYKKCIALPTELQDQWWLQMDSNHRPTA